jgi:CheY-like chemotaxis protein
MMKNKVLFVDDDPDDLLLIHEILQEVTTTYQVEEAHNGKEALECLRKSKEDGQLPCLIVLDINMPVMDGKTALSIIKSTDGLKDIPVVVFTTSKSELDKTFCKKYDVEMITKPPSYAELQEAVSRLLCHCG